MCRKGLAPKNGFLQNEPKRQISQPVEIEQLMKELMMPSCGKTNPSWHKPTQRPVGLHPIAKRHGAAYRSTGEENAKMKEQKWRSLTRIFHILGGPRHTLNGRAALPRRPELGRSSSFALPDSIMSPNDRGTRSNQRVTLTSAARWRAYLFSVAQTSKSAVSRVSKPAGRNAAEPTWKSALQQVWKPALHKLGKSTLNRYWRAGDGERRSAVCQ